MKLLLKTSSIHSCETREHARAFALGMAPKSLRDSLSQEYQVCVTPRRRAASLLDVAAAALALGVLTLWFVPALGVVAKSSKKSRCLNNLKRIGYANAVYSSQDQADMAIPVNEMQFRQCYGEPGEPCGNPIFVGAYEWGGKSGIGQRDFFSGGGDDILNSRYGSKAGFGPFTRPLNSILYPDEFEDHGWFTGDRDEIGMMEDTMLDLDVNRCPADTGYTGIHCPAFAEEELTSYDHFGTSYNANIFMIAAGAGQMYSNSPYLHRMSDLLNPSRTLAYQENNGRFAWNAFPDVCDAIPGLGVSGYVRGWHGKDWTFNAAFIDGHAETIYMRGYDNPDLGRYPPGGSYGYFQCVIIHGEGWQVDTLPAATVPTGLIYDGYGRPSWEHCLEGGLAPTADRGRSPQNQPLQRTETEATCDGPR